MTDAPDDDAELFADLSRRLRDAHRSVASLDAADDVKAAVVRRLIAVTDASKHDLRRASERLDALLDDLAAGRLPDATSGDPA